MDWIIRFLYSILYKWFSSAPSVPPGFDEEFTPPLNDGLKCSLCRLGLRDPVQTHCGHRFCIGCIDMSIRCKGRTCPIAACGQALGYWKPYNPDNFAKQEILSLNIRCPLKRTHDCPWKGPLQDLQYHLETTCLFTEVKCDCECKILRRDLHLHVTTGCPRTMDWRMETPRQEADGNKVGPVAYPVKESDISSSPGQITGFRYPVEHHLPNGSASSKYVKQSVEDVAKKFESLVPVHQHKEGKSSDGLAFSEQLKNPLSRKEKQGKKPLPHPKERGNQLEVSDKPQPYHDNALQKPKEPFFANGLDVSPSQKKHIPYQEKDGFETNGPVPVQKPNESLVDPTAMPKEPLLGQKEGGVESNGSPMAALAQGKEDDNQDDGLESTAKTDGPLLYQEEGVPEANLLDPPAEPKKPLVRQLENAVEANELQLPDVPKETMVYQKEDGDEANRSDPPDKPNESLVHQNNDVEANGLDPPPMPDNPAVLPKEDGDEDAGSELPDKPNESVVHQHDDVAANSLDPPAKPDKPVVLPKEDGNEATGSDPPDKPNVSVVQHDDIEAHSLDQPPKPAELPKKDGDKANESNPTVKPVVPMSCHGEDASGLDVSSQNHVPSLI